MRAAFEHVEAEGLTSWKSQIRREPSFSFEWHYHPVHELTLIVRGSGRRFIGDSIEPYEPGDLVLVGPDLPHAWHSSNSSSETVTGGAGDRKRSLHSSFLTSWVPIFGPVPSSNSLLIF